MFCTARDLNLWCVTGHSFKCSAMLQRLKMTVRPCMAHALLPWLQPIPRVSLTTVISLHLRPGVRATECISGLVLAFRSGL